VLIACGEIIVLWMDPESGRTSLFVTLGTYVIAYCYTLTIEASSPVR
jgi:hypothetical protein